MNESIIRLPSPATVTIADRVRAMKASGRQIIALQTGDPDFCTPSSIIDVACKAMHDGFTHYGYSRGLPELLEAVAKRTLLNHGIVYQPEREILVTCGGVHAYFCALQAVLSPGDEILIPDPAWMTHRNIVSLIRGVPVSVPSYAANDFFPTIEEWERAVTSRTRALVINSPNNPTGMVASLDYLQKLNEFADRHSLYVISDEVYDNILFDGKKHFSFAGLPGARERTIVINSLSKTYAMTGWRVGYLLAPEPVVKLAHKVSQHSITNLAPFIQKAAAFALTDLSVQQEATKMAEIYLKRRDSVLNIWRQWPETLVQLCIPKGAFYMWFDMRDLSVPSARISNDLLGDAGLAVVAGSAFGVMGEGFLRLTLAASEEEVAEGVCALLSWAQECSGERVI